MKKRYYFFITTLLFSFAVAANAIKHSRASFRSNIAMIPANLQQQMKTSTWHIGCPVPIENLCYLSLTYWGYDKKRHQGALIVHKDVANDLVQIFKILYRHKFPLEKMEPMELFNGNDNAALAANNTSAFNCREVTDQPGIFSQHSYGRAIDINSKINPYTKGRLVLPASGLQFVDRNKPYPGKITKNSLIHKIFSQYGWDWGGNWYDVQDTQHFEKRASGKKRNPYGYAAQKIAQKKKMGCGPLLQRRLGLGPTMAYTATPTPLTP